MNWGKLVAFLVAITIIVAVRYMPVMVYKNSTQKYVEFGGKWVEHFSGVTTEGIFRDAESCIINKSFYCLSYAYLPNYYGGIKVVGGG